MDTGDVILHHPSGENWVVGFVKGETLVAVGWPLEYASVRDCSIVRTATREERKALLQGMASMTDADPRKSYAMLRLSQEDLKG
jgi:hypothetical protein